MKWWCVFVAGNQQGWPCLSSLPGRSEQARCKLRWRASFFSSSSVSEEHRRDLCHGRSATIVIAYLMWRWEISKFISWHENMRDHASCINGLVLSYPGSRGRFSLSFEAAHERIRQKRPICNPNTGRCRGLLSSHKCLMTLHDTSMFAPLAAVILQLN